MKFQLIILIIFPFLITPSFSQLEQPLRVEIELENDKDDYSVLPAGEYGLVMYHQTDDRVDQRNKVKWMLTGYNPDFREVWKSAYIINDSYNVREHFYQDGYLYLLFGRTKREDVTMAKVNVITGEIFSTSGLLPRKFEVNAFTVYKNVAYINGIVNKRAGLVYFDLSTKEALPIPVKFEGIAEFQSLEIDDLNDRVNIVYSVSKRGDRFINIKSFRGKELLNDLSINPDGNDNLLSGKMTSISGQEKVIIGTYGVKGSSGSNGLYFARLINDTEFVIKYYNFTDLHKFFDFLPERDKDKIQRKKERKAAKGKELNMDYQLLVHDLIKKDGQYIMIAEAFYPTYRTEPYTYTTIINGVPVLQTRYITVFDGWLYTHSVIAGFDQEGNMIWDNSIEMGDFKSYSLDERVSVNVQEEEIVLAYGTYDEIITKVIRGNEVLDAKEDIMIKTGFEDDVIRRSQLSSVKHWYDKYFLVWGYQKIKNDRDDTRRKRTVFYFNKIAYR